MEGQRRLHKSSVQKASRETKTWDGRVTYCSLWPRAASPFLVSIGFLFHRDADWNGPVSTHLGSRWAPPRTALLWRLIVSGASQSPAPHSLQRLLSSSDYYSPAPPILQRLPSSSASHSPAPPILQRLTVSSDYHSPATTILQRLPFSSVYYSPATTILQRLLFSSDHHSSAPTILQRLSFSSAYYSPADYRSSAITILQLLCFTFFSPDTSFHASYKEAWLMVPTGTYQQSLGQAASISKRHYKMSSQYVLMGFTQKARQLFAHLHLQT
jgi:hypothetical protein